MKVKDNKGSITIFVVVGLLFMTMFLIISYGVNINKSKLAKEQFDIISEIYSHGDGDANAYQRAYTTIRRRNAQKLTMTTGEDNTSALELTKTFADTLSDYKIYGNSIQDGEEIKSVGDKSKNLFNQAITKTASFADFSNTSVRSFEEGVWYLGLTLNNYSTPTRITSYTFNKATTTFTTTSNPYGLAQAFKCEPNQTYMFSCDKTDGSNVGFGFYDAEGNFIKYVYWTEGYSYTTPENCYWMTVCFCGVTNIEATYSNAQLELGNTATDYEPYEKYRIPVKLTNANGESTTTNIYLDEPLRKIGDYSDYIDFKKQLVAKYVEVIDDTGTLTLEESFKGLTTAVEQTIDLPELETFEDYTKIEVLTEIAPSKMEVTYYGYTME